MYRKYTSEEKLNIVEGYLNGLFSLEEKAHELGYKQHQDALNDGYGNIKSREPRDSCVRQVIHLTQQNSKQW